MNDTIVQLKPNNKNKNTVEILSESFDKLKEKEVSGLLAQIIKNFNT